jgi:hypothetical protein
MPATRPPVANSRSLKKAPEILRDVPVYIGQADGVSKYAAAALLCASCGIPQTLELNLFEHPEQLVRADAGDWARCSRIRRESVVNRVSCLAGHAPASAAVTLRILRAE